MKKYVAAMLAVLLAFAGMVLPVRLFAARIEGTSDAASLDEALNYPGDTLHFTSDGDYPWVVDGERAKSSNQGVDGFYDGETGTMVYCVSEVKTTVVAQEGDYISFDVSVSSEEYDKFSFYIDGQRVERWCGDVQGEGFCSELTAGEHELSWQYAKDSVVSGGEDTAWLDNVHVGAPIGVEGVELTSNVSVPACRKVQLEWTVLPLTAGNKNVSFSSDNTNVATVDEKGFVRGINEGTTKVTICTEDGGFTAECEVTVTAAQLPVQLFGVLAAESLYYGSGAGYYRQPCTWITFDDAEPESSVIELGEFFDDENEGIPIGAAEYYDGNVYGFTGYGASPEEFFCISFEDLQDGSMNPEYYGKYGPEGSMILDMAYNYANQTMYYIAINKSTRETSLNTVDIYTGESKFIADITNDDENATSSYYSIAISTEGVGYVLLTGMDDINYGEAMLCEIDLETAHVIRNIGLTGKANYQQQSMTYDHNTGKIYWAQWLMPYEPDNTLRCIDPETGASEYMGIINGDGGCEILGMFIPYDANEPDPTPVPPTETPEDPTPTPVPPTADPTDTPNPSTDVPENPTGAPSPTVEPNTPDVPSTGAVSIIGAGIAALIGGACVMLRKRED